VTLVNIELKLINASGDGYSRYVGFAIDEPLQSKWWSTNPNQIFGIIGGKEKTLKKTLDLVDGPHTFEVGVSCPSQYAWIAELKVDEKSIASGEVSSSVFISGNIVIKGEKVVPTFDPVGRLKSFFQKLRSFFTETESVVAYRR